MGELHSPLSQYLNARIAEFEAIPALRKRELESVAVYIRDRSNRAIPSKLTFICTHNSRRSHLSQIWASVAARYFDIADVETFSGGTEATAFNHRAIAALRRCGLQITSDDGNACNPRYRVSSEFDQTSLECFSKVYNEPPNPTSHYCAVMTCSEADQACPVAMGCDLRVPIRYEDPKVADDTEQESITYDERSSQICREMLYLMSQVR